MKLLKITEPGQQDKAPASESCRAYAAGIDLGTTHSLIALVTDGEPRTLTDQHGQDIIPSVVYYGRRDKDMGQGEAGGRDKDMVHGEADGQDKDIGHGKAGGQDKDIGHGEAGRRGKDVRRDKTGEQDKDVERGGINGQDVAQSEHAVLVGAAALTQGQADARNSIASIKRLMGRSCADIKTDQFASIYDIVPGESDLPLIITAQGKKNAVEVSAAILNYLRRLAEHEISDKLAGVVITVPAYFDDAQRQAVKDAAQLAELNVYRLLNEPTAAALAYGLDKGAEGTIAVYDLGGGTFDISILRLEKGVFRVLATGGDSMLGGDDFDRALALWCLNHLNKSTPGEGARAATQHLDALAPSDKRALLHQARQIKEALSSNQAVTTKLQLGQETLPLNITRADFEQIICPLIKRTMELCQNALNDAGLKTTDIVSIVPVGGSTRIPCVRQIIADFFGKEPLTGIDPDRVVAYGAALQADLLAGNQKDNLLLLDVIPLSLGLETMGGLNERLIPRNSSIPTSQHHDFTTYKDGQTAMSFHIVQGEQELVKDCRSLAQFVLRGIPPQPAGLAKVRVTFQVDADGLLSVSAQELSTGVKTGVEVKPTYGLSPQEIKKMLHRAAAHAQSDLTQRQLKEAQLEGRKILDIITKAIKEDKAPLSNQEKTAIQTHANTLIKALQSESAETIRTQIDKLSQAAEEFMQRRMSLTLKEVVKGQGQ